MIINVSGYLARLSRAKLFDEIGSVGIRGQYLENIDNIRGISNAMINLRCNNNAFLIK